METKTQSLELLRTVTAKGERFYINSKRVSREAFITAKFGRRLDCFITRADRYAVRDYCVASGNIFAS